MALAFSTIANLLVIPALWYAGRPLSMSLKTLIAPFWSYYVSAAVIGVFWLSVSTSWSPLRNFLTQLGPVSRVLVVGGAASFCYILLVIIIERSFRSVHEVISFVKIFFTRRKA
jgi:hypothetical protein